jgi:hypothetical protein
LHPTIKKKERNCFSKFEKAFFVVYFLGESYRTFYSRNLQIFVIS